MKLDGILRKLKKNLNRKYLVLHLMKYNINTGSMDLSHIILVITLVILMIAILAPFHFNVISLEQTVYSLMNSWNNNSDSNPSYVKANATLSVTHDMTIITISIRNNGNYQLVLGSTAIIGSAQCNLEPSIIIPPQSTGEITLSIYTMDDTTMDPITVNVGGNAYSTGVPQIFCYGAHFDLTGNNGFVIIFSIVNGGDIYINVNQ